MIYYFQKQHYNLAMPEVFAQLQELDEKRVRNIRNFMVHSANIEKKVFPIINQCLDGIIKAADQINEKEVTRFFHLRIIIISSIVYLDLDIYSLSRVLQTKLT